MKPGLRVIGERKKICIKCKKVFSYKDFFKMLKNRKLMHINTINSIWEQMTYSQINQPKGWGFSRRTPNLNLSLCSKGRLSAKGIRGVPLNEQPSTRNSYITSSGDVTWLKTNMHISIRQSISLMSRLLLSAVAFIVSTTSTITLSGFRSIERKSSQERWQTC